MKQIEATKERPFYSVTYQYTQNPWTNYSHNRYGGKSAMNGRTQSGTDSFEEAKAEADKLVTCNGIQFAYVSKTEDCYNHEQVYTAEAKVL